jgi:cytoskeletal protein CcmA (bactofilin family)
VIPEEHSPTDGAFAKLERVKRFSDIRLKLDDRGADRHLVFSDLESQMWNQEATVRNEAARQPQAVQPANLASPSDERRVVAWVGKSVVFKGDLVSSEDLTIDGRVEGTIGLPDHSLTVGPDGHIRADIVAKNVTVRGAVIGTITAGEKVVVYEVGSVEGDIVSPRVVVVDGASLRGRVDTSARTGEANNLRPRLAVVGS